MDTRDDQALPQLRARRRLWLLRAGIVAFVAAYFLSPDGLQVWIPVWLPFLAALGIEVHFFVAGLRAEGTLGRSDAGAGPQERDLAELGWAARTVELPFGDATLVLHCGALGWDEILAWVDLNAAELEALGPGRHELGPVVPDAGVRIWEPPARAEGPPRLGGRIAAAAVVLALVAVVLLAATRSRGWDGLSSGERAAATRLASTEAGTIAGKRAIVTCDDRGEQVGYVQDAEGLAEVGGSRAWVTPSTCFTLYRLGEGHRVPDGVARRAIAVLAHEAWHLRGVADEGVAECYAFQSGVGLGRRLGLSDERAAGLMRAQLAENLSGAPAGYRVPAGCRRRRAIRSRSRVDPLPVTPVGKESA